MFIHLFFGSLVFLLFGKFFGMEISKTFLLMGAFFGIFPDLISYLFNFSFNKINSKFAHIHRDNFSHSIFLPLIIILIAFIFGSEMGILIGLAMLSHPILDLFGIGWGVKLFHPFSNKTFKLFYNGNFLNIWTQEQVNFWANQKGDENWIKNVYFRFNFSFESSLEFLSILGFLIIIIFFI